jgi:hypothetical protein
MFAPTQDELIYDPNGVAYGDPVLSTATVGTTLTMPVSSKPSGPGIVYSPEYKAQKLANRTSIERIVGMSSAISKIASEAQFNKSLQTFLQTGVVDQLMMEGFAEMGPSVSQTEWLSIQKRWGLTNAQLNSMKTAHANYLGLAVASPAPGGRGSAPDAAPMPMTEPEKKPNYLLWAAIAVGGFFIVRKFLK